MTRSPRATVARRWLTFLLGAVTLTGGVALSIAAGLGVGSWQVFETGLVAVTGAPLGAVLVTESLVVLVVAWVWLRQAPGPATVILALAGGPIIGWGVDHLPASPSLPVAVVEFVAGTALIALGVGLYVAPRLGATAQDSLFVGLYRTYGWRVSTARYVTDIGLVVTGWLLGGQVGPGTLVLTLAVAPVVGMTLRAGERLAGTDVPPPEPVVAASASGPHL